ncbi:MAG: LysE family transporter [Prevotella sp.]|nr:LysE family transporter [Prevotella sp.]
MFEVVPSLVPNILDFVFKGMLIGIIASAPMGPVGILCVQRTLNKGRWYGFVTGIGAAASDMLYAGITGLGMSFITDFVNDPTYRFYLQVIGSIVLLIFGVYTYRNDPLKNMRKTGKKKGSLWYNAWTAFLVTLSNPLIIILFGALFAQFAFAPSTPFDMIVSFLSVAAGALLWWYGLTWLIDKIRSKFDNNGIRIINQVIGAIVMLVSVIILIGTCTNIYRIF